jgi:hypothetical protein
VHVQESHKQSVKNEVLHLQPCIRAKDVYFFPRKHQHKYQESNWKL